MKRALLLLTFILPCTLTHAADTFESTVKTTVLRGGESTMVGTPVGRTPGHIAIPSGFWTVRPEATISDDDLITLAKDLAKAKTPGLNLDNCRLITGEGLGHLADLIDLKKLTLAQTSTDDGALATLIFLTHLEGLDLGGTRITDAGLVSVGKLIHMKRLSLAHTAITSSGLDQLSGLKDLQSIDLSRTVIVDSGLRGISHSAFLKSIKLGFTHVTDDGVQDLLAMPALEEIDLQHTGITDQALRPLSRLRNLHVLNLQCTQVTDENVKRFRDYTKAKVTTGCKDKTAA